MLGITRNGCEAVEKVSPLSYDIITMDIEMPVMNGLEALKEIMQGNSIPELIVCMLTSEGAYATLETLANGSIDFVIKKPAFTEMNSLKGELIQKVRNIASDSEIKNLLICKVLLSQFKGKVKRKQGLALHNLVERENNAYQVFKRISPPPEDNSFIGIEIFTVGPTALQEVFSKLLSGLSFPILIVHTPSLLTKSLANWLNFLSAINVKEAENMDTPTKDWAYITPGGFQMTVNKHGKFVISVEPKNLLFKLSVDLLFKALGEVFSTQTVKIIMTGMEDDGTEELRLVGEKGGNVVAQSPETCVVAGMPGYVINAKIANEIVPLKDIAKKIINFSGININNQSFN